MFLKLVKDSHILDNSVFVFFFFSFFAIPHAHNVLSSFLCKAKILNFEVFTFTDISPFDRCFLIHFYT